MEEIMSALRRMMTPGHVQFDTTFNILMGLLLAGALAAIVAKIYLTYYRGFGRPQETAMTMILISMITSTIIMAIGANLALSLGMVGALSIVRYRTAVKDMRDLAYLFWAIAIGLCCGAGAYRLVFVMTSTISLVVIVLEWMRLHDTQSQEYILIVQSDPEFNTMELMQAIPLRLKPKSSIVSKLSGQQEITFMVNLSEGKQRSELEVALKSFEGIKGYQLLTPTHEITV